MSAIRDTFFQECEEQLAALETGLLAMQTGDRDPETVNAVFRAVHSVKGGAGAFGLDVLVRFSHVFETALDDVRAGRLVPDATVVALMLRSADALSDLVRAARDGGAVDEVRDRALVAELEALGGARHANIASAATPVDDEMDGLDFQPLRFEPASSQVPAERSWVVRFRPRPELYAKANEAAVLLRELGRLGTTEVELDAGDLPPLTDLDPEGAYIAWTIRLTTAQSETTIREVFEFVEDDCELTVTLADAGDATAPSAVDLDLAALLRQVQAPIVASPVAAVASEAPPAPAPRAEPDTEKAKPAASAASDHGAGAKATIRVDLERVDRLIDLVGELVINQAVLAQSVGEAGMTRSSSVALGLSELEQLTREIQDSVMAIRAQPVKSVFQRMPRLVREVAAMTGKQVRLVTEGEATEVDKTVIEHLADPLTHMIRNAIDHGLEKPEARAAAGKPAEGTVRLAAFHRSGRIVIEVSDDGAGINRARVRASAVAKGLIAADATLTDDEVDNLIFLPGFSTAEAISDISGRGVGMDVVKRSIQALGGRIAIASRPGQGSTFTMSLPLTLAVLDGMVVSVAGQTLVVPLTAMVETLQPKASEVHSLGHGAQVISIRGTYIPLIDVGVCLGYRDAAGEAGAGVALLIEGEGGARAALVVDNIQGQRQVVIKSLEANYQSVRGIAAATILGDGRVALILDVDTIVAAHRSGPPRTELQTAGFAYA
ncbi:chemotaxis protein CheA [Muricoccus radiodurans]|uniref:chemotaxis protein CheA n=1 Tax=Muricoccus radiodurans TaxID=2231721 RepID=UPI003CF99974